VQAIYICTRTRLLLIKYDEKRSTLHMTKQSLQVLFDAMYHGKHSFDDFMHSSVQEHYEVFLPGKVGKRTIFKPKENLKIYQKFLNLFLFEFLPLNERVVFSYRKGLSAYNAVEKHRSGRYFFQTDISSFFESIDSALVRKTILAGESFTPVSDVHEHINRILELVCVNDSLPIGFPASAPLSNCVLLDFDNEIEGVCESMRLSYSRYADDIIISGKEKEVPSNMPDIVQSILHKSASEKLYLNKGKTKFFQTGGKLKILGMLILPNGKISPDTKKKRELEVLLHFYLTDRTKFNEMVSEIKARSGKKGVGHEDEYPDVLSGNLNYVDSIDPDYTDKLRRKFGVATIDSLMYKELSGKK